MSVTRIKKQKSVREQVSEAEWAKRVDLAAAYRTWKSRAATYRYANAEILGHCR